MVLSSKGAYRSKSNEKQQTVYASGLTSLLFDMFVKRRAANRKIIDFIFCIIFSFDMALWWMETHNGHHIQFLMDIPILRVEDFR